MNPILEIRSLKEQVFNPKLLYKEYCVENFAGAVIRWGQRVSYQDRIKEIQRGFAARGIQAPSLDMDLGVKQLYVNRLPQLEAETQGIQIVASAMQRTMDRLGWEPDSVEGIFVGSSLVPLNGSTYPQVFADELGLRNAKQFYVNAACTSGGLALFEALSQKEMRNKRVLVGATEVMLRRAMRYDPTVMDEGSGLIFSQGAVVMGIVPGQTISLKGDYIFFEKPDSRSLLAAQTNYQTTPFKEGSIVEKSENGIRVQLPIPQDGRFISMSNRVGGLFGPGAKETVERTKQSMSIHEWNNIVAMLMHFPNKLIGAHLIEMMLKYELMPERILAGMDKDQALQVLKEKGLPALPLYIYPKENLYGNAPAANALIALIESWSQLKGIGDILMVVFGAGATYAGGKIAIK